MSRGGHITMGDRLQSSKTMLEGLHKSSVFQEFKNTFEMEKSGLGENLYEFNKAQKEVFDLVMESWKLHRDKDDFYAHFILTPFYIDIETGKNPMKDKLYTLNDTLLYYWANPWKVAEVVLGKEQLSKTNPQNEFTGFIKKQKYILRDLMDPSIMKIGITAGRGCAKTFLLALDGVISIYLIPHFEHAIISGSDKQAGTLYKYLRLLLTGSQIEKLIEGGRKGMMKRRMESITDGYTEAYPASLTAVQSQRTNKVTNDEICEMTPDVLDYAYGTLAGREYTKWIESGTPNYMQHRFYEHYNEARDQERMTPQEQALIPRDARWKWYNITHFECRAWIPEYFTNSFINQYGRDSHQYKIMVLGEFAPAAGTVYDQNNLRLSIIDDLPETIIENIYDNDDKLIEVRKDVKPIYHTYWTGIDIGYSDQHLTVYIESCEDQNGTVYITDELVPDQHEDVMANELEAFMVKNRSDAYADAGSVGKSLNMRMPLLLISYDLSFQTISFQKLKMAMVENCMGLLNTHSMFILSRCKGLIRELEKVCWDENSQIERIKKGGDDHHDAWILSCWGHRNALLDAHYRRDGDSEPINLEDHLEPTGNVNDGFDPTLIYKP